MMWHMCFAYTTGLPAAPPLLPLRCCRRPQEGFAEVGLLKADEGYTTPPRRAAAAAAAAAADDNVVAAVVAASAGSPPPSALRRVLIMQLEELQRETEALRRRLMLPDSGAA